MKSERSHITKPLGDTRSIYLINSQSKILLNDVMYIQSEDKYLLLLTTGKNELVRGKMYEIMEELPDYFFAM